VWVFFWRFFGEFFDSLSISQEQVKHFGVFELPMQRNIQKTQGENYGGKKTTWFFSHLFGKIFSTWTLKTIFDKNLFLCECFFTPLAEN
jgi:hypothetical protein